MRVILPMFLALVVSLAELGALAQCPDNSGMVPAPQYGLVPGPQYGGVPMPQYGMVPAPQYGFVPAPQYGMLPAQPFGQIPFGGLGLDICPIPMPSTGTIVDTCPPEPFFDANCPEVGTPSGSGAEPHSGAVSRVTNLIPSLPAGVALPSTSSLSAPGDLSSVISDVFHQGSATPESTSSFRPGTIEYYSDELNKDPQCAKCHYNRALVYAKHGQFGKALADYNEAIALNPNNDLYYYNRGIAYLALKQYPQALDSYSRAITIKPDCSRCFYRRSQVLLMLGKLQESLTDCNKALALDPSSAVYPYHRGNIYGRLGQYLAALKDYDAAIARKPDFAGAYASRGIAYYAIGQYQMVIDDYDQVIKLNPSNSQAYFNRATAFYELGQYQKAMEDCDKAISLNPKCSQCYYKRCLAKLMLGLGESAATDARRAIDLVGWHSPNSLYLAIYAYLGYMQAHQEHHATSILNKAVTSYSGTSWPYPVLQYFLNKITLAQLLALATDNIMLTQARAYIGLVAAWASSQQDSLIHLSWVKEQGVSGVPEYLLVLNQLQRMYPKGAVRSARPAKDKWALVIGISKFKDPTILLKYADKDAKDFADYLVAEGHFAADHVKLLVNEQASRENILAQLGDKWLPRVANPEDLVLIFMSTHGSPSKADIAGVNYIVAYNTDKDNLYATGLPIQDLTRMVKDRVQASRTVIIMDACHSGAAHVNGKGLYRQSNFAANEIAQESGQMVICSSKPEEISWESKRYPNGVFTHYLIEGLRQKGRYLKLDSVYQYLKSKVELEVRCDRGQMQTPVLKSMWKGEDLVLTAPTAKPGAAAKTYPVPRKPRP